jgi:hypothetical protein
MDLTNILATHIRFDAIVKVIPKTLTNLISGKHTAKHGCIHEDTMVTNGTLYRVISGSLQKERPRSSRSVFIVNRKGYEYLAFRSH